MVVYRLALGLNQAAGLVAFFRNPGLVGTGPHPGGRGKGCDKQGFLKKATSPAT